ncbi:MAG: hypothetical protein SGPRY_004304 [Prymnesium sp.]
MERCASFVNPPLMGLLVRAITLPALSWYALKLGCLMARADANSLALLREGGVRAVLQTMGEEGGRGGGEAEAEGRGEESAARVEVGLALLQNVAYSNEGVASILGEGGVGVVLGVMKAHATCVGVQTTGLGHHSDNLRIEESVIDMLWDLSSTGEGQAHILTAGGVPPILHVLRNEQRDSEFLKKVRPPAKCPAHRPTHGTLRAAHLPTLEGLVAHHSSPGCQALSMLWNLSISANGISSVMMTTHLNSDEIQQNSLGILRNLSDSTEGQACSPSHPGGGGQHLKFDEVVELSIECLSNMCQGSLQNTLSLVLEADPEANPNLPLSIPLPSLPQELPAAAPMLGAILHASPGAELRTNVLIGLALLTSNASHAPSPSPPSPHFSPSPRSPPPVQSEPSDASADPGVWAGKLLLRLRGIQLLGRLLSSDEPMMRQRGARAAQRLLRLSGGRRLEPTHTQPESSNGAALRSAFSWRAPSRSSGRGRGGGRERDGGSGVRGSEGHGSPEPLHNFAGYLGDKETADVVFTIGGQQIHAHRQPHLEPRPQ